MKNIWRQFNYIVRGEPFLHVVSMFSFTVVLVQLFLSFNMYLPNWVLLMTFVIVAIAWEYAGKALEGKRIDYLDGVYTILGGLLAIIILRFL